MRQICTAQEFKTSIEELCEDCPLKMGMLEQADVEIRQQAIEWQKLLPEEEFISYIKKEIKKAFGIMEEIYLMNMNQADNAVLINRIDVYIWNKERLKILNEFYPQTSLNSDVYEKIKEGDLMGAMKDLLSINKENSKTGKEVILLMSGYSHIEEEKRKRVIGLEEYLLQRNKICNALIELL